MKKTLLIFFILLSFLLVFTAYQKIKFDDGKLHIIFCNVGQGDGILIRTPNLQDIILDAGPDNSILSCISRHTPFWDRDIELMLLSHPHADHMAGMISILSSYKVLAFATEELRNTTSVYKKLTDVIKEKSVQTRVLYAGDSFVTKDNLSIKVLGPTKEFIARTSPGGKIGETKEFASLELLVTFGNFKALFTGDSQIEELNEARSLISGVDIFQIPHHGSRFGTDSEFLSLISPDLAVISVGKNNYGHPAPPVLKILNDLNIKTLRTDQHGDIEILVDKSGKFSVK